MSELQPQTEPRDEFVRLFSRYQPRIYSYISTLLPNDSDADDVMSETSVVLWRKWRIFEQDIDFLRWACGVARNEVLHFRRAKCRDRIIFSPALMDLITASFEKRSEPHEARRQALNLCVQELAPSDHRMVELRYTSGMTALQVASELKRPENTVYKALARIRRQLFECVHRRLAREEHLA